MANIEYLIRLKSEDLTQYLRETASWTPGEKLEYDIDVDSSEKTINFGDVDSIRFFFIFTDSPIKVSITEEASTVDFEIQDLFVFTPTSDFITRLTSIGISALGGTANVNVRIYGE